MPSVQKYLLYGTKVQILTQKALRRRRVKRHRCSVYLLNRYKSANTDAGAAAAGLFHPFIGDTSVKIFGVEAGGENQSLWHPHFRQLNLYAAN
jgi:hypothetical protein